MAFLDYFTKQKIRKFMYKFDWYAPPIYVTYR